MFVLIFNYNIYIGATVPLLLLIILVLFCEKRVLLVPHHVWIKARKISNTNGQFENKIVNVMWWNRSDFFYYPRAKLSSHQQITRREKKRGENRIEWRKSIRLCKQSLFKYLWANKIRFFWSCISNDDKNFCSNHVVKEYENEATVNTICLHGK